MYTILSSLIAWFVVYIVSVILFNMAPENMNDGFLVQSIAAIMTYYVIQVIILLPPLVAGFVAGGFLAAWVGVDEGDKDAKGTTGCGVITAIVVAFPIMFVTMPWIMTKLPEWAPNGPYLPFSYAQAFIMVLMVTALATIAKGASSK